MNPKEAAQQLLGLATQAGINFPAALDTSKRSQVCGATVMLFRNSESIFDLEEALKSLKEKYGVVESHSDNRKRVRTHEDSKLVDGEAPLKVKKTDIVAVEKNRPLAEAIKEMADIFFKNKDARKGGVFSKAAKSLRETDDEIVSGKQALKLDGIGKGIAGYIQEFLDNGSIEKLEELRTGF